MLRLLILCSLALFDLVLSQNMTNPAVKRFFKYTDQKTLTSVTGQLNSAKNVTLCKNQCTTFANSKSFIGSGVTVDKTDPVSKPATAATNCQAFCAHRCSLKKYLDYQYGRLGSNNFTPNKAAQMKSIFLQTDRDTNNNFTKTAEVSYPKIMAQVPAEKQKLLKDTVTNITTSFYKDFPADAQNVFTYKY